jgi:hypothetical protein
VAPFNAEYSKKRPVAIEDWSLCILALMKNTSPNSTKTKPKKTIELPKIN